MDAPRDDWHWLAVPETDCLAVRRVDHVKVIQASHNIIGAVQLCENKIELLDHALSQPSLDNAVVEEGFNLYTSRVDLAVEDERIAEEVGSNGVGAHHVP